MEHRDRSFIMRDILTAALERTEGLYISQLMEYVNLTSSQAKTYLTELLKHDLISRNDQTRRYHTTPKGAIYLKTVDRLFDILDKPGP